MSQDMPADRPMPHPTIVTTPFWDACRRRQLLLQHCSSCDMNIFYPRNICSHCGSRKLRWLTASGRGRLYTYTVARRATHRLLESRLPYVIAIVELDEGPMMTSTIVDTQVDSLRIGQALQVDYEDFDEISIPVFRSMPEYLDSPDQRL
jgi:uncharacterized OB-fold protein